MIDKELLKKKQIILDLRDKIKEESRKMKAPFIKEWYRNIQFLIGKQWIVYDRSQKKWTEAKLEKWYPKPVTNKFAAAGNTLKTLLTQEEPRILVTPAMDTEESIASAQIGDSLIDVLQTESESEKAKEIASSWLVFTGNCFLGETYSVDKKFGETFIPFEMCQSCGKIVAPDEDSNGKCPACGGELGKAISQDGKEIGRMFPKGKLSEEGISPFEIHFDQKLENFSDVQEVVRSKKVDIPLLEESYPSLKGKIETGDEGNIDETYSEALFGMTNSGVDGSKSSFPKGVADYLYKLPSSEFPDGLMATVIGSEIVELSELIYKDREDNRKIPIFHIGANRVPGRFWHKTLLDDVVPLQLKRNKLESFIELQTYTMASGKWLEPDNSNMDAPTGEPGQRLKYTPQGPGVKPEMVRGLPPPPILMEMIQQIDKDIEEIAATYDVLKGNLPQGLDTFGGLRLLTERAFSRHNEMIRNWERGNEESSRMQLEIGRLFFDEPRKHTYENENGSWETREFTKADLSGGIDIRVERGSTLPRSKTVEDDAIRTSIKAGIIDIRDPKVNYKVLEKLGQADLASSVGLDIKDAMREWKEFIDSVERNPETPEQWKIRPRQDIDNEIVHYNDAVSRAKMEEFFKLPPAAQKIWEEHIIYHKTILNKQMAQQAAMGQVEKPQPVAA